MKKLRMALALTTLASLLACDSNQGGSGSTLSGNLNSGFLSSFPSNKSNLRISLTDAPSRDLKSVFVNVDHAELFVKKGSGEGRLIVAQDLGLVDLMTLRSGVLLPLQDLSLPSGLEITAIRLILKGDNNYSIKADDSRCDMQTPSGQQSGIKIHLSQSFLLEEGQAYSMVMDFDAEKSVVVKGTGECLLKPVLKLLNVTKVSDSDPEEEGTDPDAPELPVTEGTDSNAGGDFEGPPVDGSEQPPVLTIEDTFNLG